MLDITEHMAAATTTTTKSTHVRHYDFPHRQYDAVSVVGSELSGGSFRLSASFSVASFRRKIIDSIRCGRSGIAGCSNDEDFIDISPPKHKPNLKSPVHSPSVRSERSILSDFLSIPISTSPAADEGYKNESRESESGNDAEEIKRRKVERFEEMTESVKLLSLREMNKKWDGAKGVRRLARDDSEARTTLAMLGAIPPLVEMLNLEDDEWNELVRIEALYALLNLSIGNERNKQAIVKAGAVHKMLHLTHLANGPKLDPSLVEPIVANFLSLTASDTNKPIVGSTSNAIPFLVTLLKNSSSTQLAAQDALKALHNLSIHPSNITLILQTDLVPHLITTLGDTTSTTTDACSGRFLSILTNLVSTHEGRAAISSAGPDAFPVLIDVLNWVDSPGCQEKAAHVLLVMALKGRYSDRRAMVEAGIASAALELTLIGSVLAQKRGSMILECLRMDKGKHRQRGFDGASGSASGWGVTVSAPMSGGGTLSSCSTSSCSSSCLTNVNNKGGDGQVEVSEEKQAVKELVQLSLQSNMRKIVRRANLVHDFVGPSQRHRLVSLSGRSSSLPF